MSQLILFLSGIFSWCLSTLVGGGGSMVFIPQSIFFIPPAVVTPATSIAGLMSSGQRIFLFFKDINKELAILTMPFMALGSFTGAYLFSKINYKIFAIFLMMFYTANGLSSVFKGRLTFRVKKWYFPIAAYVCGFLSGEIGVGGPFLNPFYINYGAKKEELLGTKAVSLVVTQITKIVTYIMTGVLTHKIMLLGFTAGCGAVVGNWIGKRLLIRISEETFRHFVNISLIVCAFIILNKYWLNLF